jgi:Cu(I)/Ag(I) efflux system membrane fusion protein
MRYIKFLAKYLLPLLLIASFFLLKKGDRHEHEVAKNPVSEQTAEVWTCSMHPQIRYPDNSVKCPICFMDLILLTATDNADSDELSFSTLPVSPQSFATVPVRKEAFEQQHNFYGRTAFDPEKQQVISSRLHGRIDRLLVRSVGQRVNKGEVLWEIYSPELIVAQQEFIDSIRQSSPEKKGKTAVSERFISRPYSGSRGRQRLSLLGFSESEIAQLALMDEAPERTAILAPFNGQISQISVKEGEYVKEGQPLLELAGTDTMRVELQIPESAVFAMSDILQIRGKFPAFPLKEFKITPLYFEPALNLQTRNATLVGIMDNGENFVAAGSFLQAELSLKGGDGLLLPHEAVLFLGDKAQIMVKKKDLFRTVFVRILAKTETDYVVAGNLQAGDQVVRDGLFKLDAEFQIRGRESMMSHPQRFVPFFNNPGADLRREAIVLLLELQHDTAGREFAVKLWQNYAEMQSLLADDYLAEAETVLQSFRHLLAVAEGRLADFARIMLRELTGENSRHHFDPVTVPGDGSTAKTELLQMRNFSSAGISPEAIRQAFRIWSDWLIQAKEAGLSGGEDLRKAYCPMAFDGEGAFWLQKEEIIFNPYFGSAMLHCGEWSL